MVKRVDDQMDAQTGSLFHTQMLNVRMCGCTDGQVGGPTDGQVGGRTDGQVSGRTDGQVGGRTDG